MAKPKQEKNAKGLVGWKDGKRDKAAPNSVGNYKRASLNLSGKELGAKGRKAASARTVKIGQTKYEGKKVYGPGGNLLTGKVDLGGGNIGVYRKGVRVTAAKPKPTTRTSTAAPKPTAKTTRVPPSKRQEGGRTPGNKSATSGTVTSAIAQGNKKGPKDPAKNKDMVFVPAINRYVPKAGYTAKTNPYNKARVTGMREGRANVPEATLTALSLYGGGRLAVPAIKAAVGRTGLAKAGQAAGQGAREGLESGVKAAQGGARSTAKAATSTAKKATVKKTTVKKTTAPVKKTTPAKKTTVKKTTASKKPGVGMRPRKDGFKPAPLRKAERAAAKKTTARKK